MHGYLEVLCKSGALRVTVTIAADIQESDTLENISKILERRNVPAALSHHLPSLRREGEYGDLADLLEEFIVLYRRWENLGVEMNRSNDARHTGFLTRSFTFRFGKGGEDANAGNSAAAARPGL